MHWLMSLANHEGDEILINMVDYSLRQSVLDVQLVSDSLVCSVHWCPKSMTETPFRARVFSNLYKNNIKEARLLSLFCINIFIFLTRFGCSET